MSRVKPGPCSPICSGSIDQVRMSFTPSVVCIAF